MSFDDYANHIAQKLRLATAIAVLRSKPKNLSTQEYIGKLRENIESMDYDSDVTICSDDFNVDCDDVIKDFEYNNTPNNKTVVHKSHLIHNTNVRNNADINSHTALDDVIHNKYGNSNEIHYDNKIRHNNTDLQVTNSNIRTDMNKDKSNKVAEYVGILQELKQVDNTAQDKINRHQISNSQTQEMEDMDLDATYCESLTNTQMNKNNNTLEETKIYSLSDFTPFYTHYSESQMLNLTINPKMIHKNQINEMDLNNTQFEYTQNAQNSESLNDFNQNTSNIRNYNPKSNIGTNDRNNADDINIDNDENIYNEIINDKPPNSIITNDTNIDDSDTNLYSNSKNTHVGNKVNSYPDDVNYAKDTKTHSDIENNTIAHIITNDDIQSNDSNDLTNSQKEIVPFKVIEELNKIKTYLKKRNDRRISCDGSSDSGYRSDSQGRHSRNSLQISGSCLNQSAHSLLTYIITCSLSKNTYDITREVSRALGSLIDKLHEDELYPSFLEILLETITELLTSIYEEDSCTNVLLSKDEKVQRVLLLNKSTHIQKYTIDKITDILETIDTEANEIAHTAKMENLCYIFHILEIILSKHKVEQSSQSQESQEKVLKRSSITDIWRKKWNLSKDVVIENVEKKCALTKCSEVLNKMIVNCMEAYSLISFVALKCFNLLQP